MFAAAYLRSSGVDISGLKRGARRLDAKKKGARKNYRESRTWGREKRSVGDLLVIIWREAPVSVREIQ
jgi:hypothetical protein